ncbi:MarR family winged helix-turn-helix transcriptional regulator [Companilactobacillus mishanensis]|uniref:Winged helix-turn-helix transcriptional regulator n=1 Tax=Companilactobacillus mishanensis TaxID=2486008 RepID=A0A5P0ZJW9_9LACO|nr:MarR family winged helix-turn-helix transcriptional regulator [Companilactobacillus mishanensis]MQS52977.1 winged helix-turn-helix transcriptional regulator [Companilactobacillus mishanensis]
MDVVKIGKYISSLHRRFQIAESHKYALPEINVSNANFLLFIDDSDKITAKQIATELAINKGLVSREMTHLDKAGYITKKVDDNDRRTTWIRITPKGEAACKTIRKIKLDLWNQVLGDTTDAELKTVFDQTKSWSEKAELFD